MVVLSEPTRPTQNSYGARLLRNEFCSVLLGQLLFQLALSGQTAFPNITQSTSWRIGINPDPAALASVLPEQSAFQGTYAYP